MDSKLRVYLNVCKSWGCPNLGIPDAVDYVSPVYRLGYPALMCSLCGSLPPLFDEQECDAWFARYFAYTDRNIRFFCPRGCLAGLIHYGRTHAGTERYQCGSCRAVFSPEKQFSLRKQEQIRQFLAGLHEGRYTGDTTQHRLLRQVVNWCQQNWVVPPVNPENIATEVFMLPFQGQSPAQLLYVVLSVDAYSGYVLHISTNYSHWETGASLRYQSTGRSEPKIQELATPANVLERERIFMARRQFDDIQYGPACLKKNDHGNMVRPVIAIHGHFQHLKRCYPAVTDHYLAHECVLRGAAITAWAQEVRTGQTQLWFVTENMDGSAVPGRDYRHNGSWIIGWWSNVWQGWSNGEEEKMIGLLTGQKNMEAAGAISLSGCHDFIFWLKSQPCLIEGSKLSAGVISQQLLCFAYIYNKMLMAKLSNNNQVSML